MAGHVETTTVSEYKGGNLSEGVVNVGSVLHYDVTSVILIFFNLYWDHHTRVQSSYLPPQHLSGERIAPGKK